LSIRFTDEARGERFFDTKFAMVPVGPNTIYIHRSVTPYGGFGRTALEYGLDKQIRKGELLDLVHSWEERHTRDLKRLMVKVKSARKVKDKWGNDTFRLDFQQMMMG
jgi:hypothetical protein